MPTLTNLLKNPTTIILLLAALVSGCDSTLAAEDYDQTCQTAADCVAVPVGDFCDCACEGGAIAKSELPKYNADESDARDACIGAKMCGACGPLPGVTCTAGKCALMP